MEFKNAKEIKNPHSFAILAYKNSPYLSECIESLLNQTINSEIFITTSTPSDYILEISKKYKIPLYINVNKSGIVSDWNFAFNKCATPLLTLAHQDDLYSKDYTEKMIESVGKYPNFLIGFCDYGEIFYGKYRNKSLKLFIKYLLLKWHFGRDECLLSNSRKKNLVAFGSPIPCPSVIYNRDNLKDFSFSVEYKLNLDWDAWLRIAEMEGRIIYVKHRMLYYRIHSDSETTMMISSSLRKNEDIQMFKRIWPDFIVRIIMFFYRYVYQLN